MLQLSYNSEAAMSLDYQLFLLKPLPHLNLTDWMRPYSCLPLGERG